MPEYPANRSRLVRMKVVNFGCIGDGGLEIALDDIVCLVGANNCGKSTVLRAYEAAIGMARLKPDEIHSKATTATTVELWVHIPDGAENIDSKWKENANGLKLVRSKWTWTEISAKGGGIEYAPVRSTWDPEQNNYAEDGKAAGLDNVFNSRLPKPFRIGSLENPEEEHKKLMELVLEPIKAKLALLMKDDASDLSTKIKAVQTSAEEPVKAFQINLEKVQSRVNSSFKRVFSKAVVKLDVSLGELGIDPSAALSKASRINVEEVHGSSSWERQGTGAQRTLFWSMLEVRSELNRISDENKRKEKDSLAARKELKKLQDKLGTLKKQDAIEKCKADILVQEKILADSKPNDQAAEAQVESAFLPGYMLLIDEPETALHPSAVRAAKSHLYSLASESGWQVMLSTHHPAFVDPLKDHTSIVRLHRPEAKAPPNVYRADHMTFQGDDKQNLKTLLAFDQTVAEMFFATNVIIVEGDTEFAAFMVAMDKDEQAFPLDGRPLILRARGKWTIPVLIRMLMHFKVNFAVLHDVDSPKSEGGAKKNGAYSANDEITKAIKMSRDAGVHVIHRCSEPDFERKHGMALPTKDKPFAAWKAVTENQDVLKSVRTILNELSALPDGDAANHKDDGKHYETKCRTWAAANAKDDPAFAFD
ncbi:MAG TPA: TOPRIM nucleotidyl transferase/hydrolase domain-containing protein [Tepidisphaeraceae bacterium]|nr:TOPRIM nucleotidyl transferase/hydrolase domain-containing protein [Tepidisphaeraceae bacterium]